MPIQYLHDFGRTAKLFSFLMIVTQNCTLFLEIKKASVEQEQIDLLKLKA